MSWIDFFIGLALMNAMPHWVLGIWKGRMLSGLGIGNWQNLAYGLLNFGIASGLFFWKYSLDDLLSNGFMVGALFVLLMYFATGHFFYRLFHVRFYAKNPG